MFYFHRLFLLQRVYRGVILTSIAITVRDHIIVNEFIVAVHVFVGKLTVSSFDRLYGLQVYDSGGGSHTEKELPAENDHRQYYREYGNLLHFVGFVHQCGKSLLKPVMWLLLALIQFFFLCRSFLVAFYLILTWDLLIIVISVISKSLRSFQAL